MIRIFILFSLTAFVCRAQEDRAWRLGLIAGPHGNSSRITGGMETANARFHHNKFGGGELAIAARYDHNHHWMVSWSLGFHTYGFEYAIAENYSLLAKNRRFSTIRTDFAAFEIPAMVHYKFSPNCRNVRWLIGAGVSQQLSANISVQKSISKADDGNTANSYISSNSSNSGGFSIMPRFSVAREKIYKNGSFLNLSLLVNIGLTDLATSTVNYTLDNESYIHEFSNTGSFVGLRLSYFFRPLTNSPVKSSRQNRTPGT